jgi:hypothetical protein
MIIPDSPSKQPEYDPEFVDEILRADEQPPGKSFNNFADMMAWLEDLEPR